VVLLGRPRLREEALANPFPNLGNFFGWNAADFGWGRDGTQNILWRLVNGELDGVSRNGIVVLAGTNNVGTLERGEARETRAPSTVALKLRAVQDVPDARF